MIFLDLTAGVADKYLAGPALTSRPLHKAASRVVVAAPASPHTALTVLSYDQPRHVARPPAFILRRVAALTSLTGVDAGGGGGAVFPSHP